VRPPKSFVRASEPGWTSVELRDKLPFDQAWQSAVDIVAKQFEMEMISKDGGYARTAWLYTWAKQGRTSENYRVRVIIKFSADRKSIDIKAEANYLQKGEWVVGYDDRLLSTVKSDIMGVIGRTTR